MRSEGLIPAFLLDAPAQPVPARSGKRLRAAFIDKGLHHLSDLIKTTYVQWDTAQKAGLFQGLDGRVKALFLVFFVVVVSLEKQLFPQALIGVFVFLLAVLSRLGLVGFYKRVLFLGFAFGFLIAAPSCLNLFAPGQVVVPLAHFDRARDFWVYHVPATIGITREGLEGVAMLTLRVVNSVSVSFLVVYTTPFPQLLKAGRSLRVPDAFLLILSLAYKYIFLFARTLEDMHLSRKGRTVETGAVEGQGWVAGRMAFLFRRTQLRCEEVFKAMLGRGFAGEVALYAPGSLRPLDVGAAIVLLAVGAGFLWWPGRL